MERVMSQDQAYAELRQALEAAVGRKMRSPRDFDFLANAILEKIHQSVSTSTLKRFWGYLPQYASIRLSTLDLLTQFLDYKDWEDFIHSRESQLHSPDTDADVQTPLSDGDTPSPKARYRWGMVALLALVLLGGAVLLWSGVFKENEEGAPVSKGQYILKRGQIFETSSDYLRLFGITSTERYWDQPVPHHEGIVIWGPEYHHPQWHNEGQRDSLMPTITEWWTPADSSLSASPASEAERQLLSAEKNEHLYFTVMRTNELRITFMKNLIDTGFVFLGVYRTDLRKSDITHVVWERVADECDLNNLTYLQQLRH